SGGPDLGLLEVNDAAEIVHAVAHPDANIIMGAVIDDAMGDEIRVTVIAAGFDRPAPPPGGGGHEPAAADVRHASDIFGDEDDDELGIDDDDFDVPSFLR